MHWPLRICIAPWKNTVLYTSHLQNKIQIMGLTVTGLSAAHGRLGLWGPTKRSHGSHETTTPQFQACSRSTGISRLLGLF